MMLRTVLKRLGLALVVVAIVAIATTKAAWADEVWRSDSGQTTFFNPRAEVCYQWHEGKPTIYYETAYGRVPYDGTLWVDWDGVSTCEPSQTMVIKGYAEEVNKYEGFWCRANLTLTLQTDGLGQASWQNVSVPPNQAVQGYSCPGSGEDFSLDLTRTYIQNEGNPESGGTESGGTESGGTESGG